MFKKLVKFFSKKKTPVIFVDVYGSGLNIPLESSPKKSFKLFV